MTLNLTTVQASTTVSFGVDLYLVDASSGSITVTLPVATGNAGSVLQFKRIDWVSSNTVTIVPNGSDGSVIDGSMTSLLMSPGHWVYLFVDSSNNWQRTISDQSSSFAFGDASDGVVAISSNTTLSRDMYYLQLDVSGGAIVNTNGFRIFVADRLTLTGNGTKIHNNGSNASGGTGGAGGGGSTPGNLVSTIGGGYAGSNGVLGLLTAGTAGLPNVSTPECLGGAGGVGGSAGATLGGIAGLNIVPSVSSGGIGCIRQSQNALTARDFASATLIGGSSGGSGGVNSLTATSGGGGGSGGIVMIAARSVMCDAKQACTISSIGGNGGNASGSGNAGGGGGGGGGCLIIISRVSNLLANCPGLTVSVAGGSGGSPTGTANAGAAGSAGTTKVIDRL